MGLMVGTLGVEGLVDAVVGVDVGLIKAYHKE